MTMINELSNLCQVQIYLSEVLDLFAELNSQQKWDEKTSSPTRKKLLSALESLSGYNPELLLRRLPPDALYEEHAILLGKMNQHELALSIYVYKVIFPPLSTSYFYDRILSNPWLLPRGFKVWQKSKQCQVLHHKHYYSLVW